MFYNKIYTPSVEGLPGSLGTGGPQVRGHIGRGRKMSRLKTLMVL